MFKSTMRKWLHLCWFLPAACASAAETRVTNAAELRAAVSAAAPGSVILIAPGVYREGFNFRNVRGSVDKPIVIAGADPKNPPRFEEGGMQFSNPFHLELRDLHFEKIARNGLNIDDGGSQEPTARGIKIRNIQVRDVGPKGNIDGIKLSGLYEFEVSGCQVERWGNGGSGIDMVGCHQGVIEKCSFKHENGQGSNAVQCKGGSTKIVIRDNRFENAGVRAVNIGGSTGLQFFRPALKEGEEHAEAREIVVEGNTFIGGDAALAFVGVKGAIARNNVIYLPRKWAIRVLQETKSPGFVPCQQVEISDNVFVFDSAGWSEGGLNIGGGTAPETFTFARNHWYCRDRPDRSTPRLPVKESGGNYGKPIQFVDEAKGDLRLRQRSGS